MTHPVHSRRNPCCGRRAARKALRLQPFPRCACSIPTEIWYAGCAVTVAHASMRALGLLAVEMEAAALYAFARARNKAVVCFAHVTNQMGRIEQDFEKGEADGSVGSLAVIRRTAAILLSDPN